MSCMYLCCLCTPYISGSFSAGLLQPLPDDWHPFIQELQAQGQEAQKEHRCFCILQKPSQMTKTCIYLEGVPRWIRAGESQTACTKGKAYQRGNLFHCLCRSMTQPLQGDAKESGAEKDSLGGSGIVFKSSSALGHRFSDWVACLWGWTKQSRRAQAGKEEAGTFAMCLSFMVVF